MKSIIFLLTAGLSSLAYGQYLPQGNKLAGTGALSAAAGQGSGVALSANGNTAAVGASGENAVWVFTRTNGTWSQQGSKLIVTGAAGSAGVGYSMALSADGNTMIAGGPFDASNVGASWVFVRDGNGNWSQQGGKLTGNDSVGASEQGFAVALSPDGNTAMIGGALDAAGLGAAWIFKRSNGVWTQQGSKLVGTGAIGGAWQGDGVALSADGNTALSGGPFDASLTGATWVFVRNPTTGAWTQQGSKLVGSGGTGMPYQGTSVALSSDGNTALIGAPFDGSIYAIGAAWVFTRAANGTWSQQGGKLTANDSSFYPKQGSAVALSADGNTAVVGGPQDSFGAGAAWVYSRNAAGTWSQLGSKLTAGGGLLGTSVAMSTDANTILVGGPGDSGGAGAAFPFVQISLGISAAANAGLNVAVPVSVTLLQPNGQPYNGSATVHFTSSDAAAVLPADTLVTGSAVVNVTFKTSGSQTLTATVVGRSSITATSSPILVGAALPATHFSVTGPTTAVTGLAAPITVTALDASNQTVIGYRGTVHFTSTDPATLPADAVFASGVAHFSVLFATVGNQTITATDTVNPSITGTSAAIAVSAVAPAPPTPAGVTPTGGITASTPLSFTFNDPRGAQDLGVMNVLINRVLDGRSACYIAYSQPSNLLYLINDDGATYKVPAGSSMAAAGTVNNSQCTVTWTNTAVTKNGNSLNLALNFTFTTAFGGNKVVYVAARDVVENNSDWQAQGVWQVPGAAQNTTTSVTGVNFLHGSGLGPASMLFAAADTNGTGDLGVVNILINSAIDGTHACYLAYSRPLNLMYLVNDAGTALLAGQSMATSGSTSNSQCSVSWGVNGVSTAGNTQTLNLVVTFTQAFTGNRVVYLAARDVNEGNNTDWQAIATWSVQ